MSTFRQKIQATTNWVKPDPEDLDEARREPPAASACTGKRQSAPVTAHRLFPAFAALWFAALLGLGSLVIPGIQLGAIVVGTGLPALVPAAAPPLGFTAHLLVALALAMLGAALGLLLGLRLRSPRRSAIRPAAAIVVPPTPEADTVYKVRARDAHPDAPPRRPLVLAEALGEKVAEVPAEPEPEVSLPLLRRKRTPAAGGPIADPSAPQTQEAPFSSHAVVRPLDLSALDLDGPLNPPFFTEPERVEPRPPFRTETAPAQWAQPAAPVLLAATPQLPVDVAGAHRAVSGGERSPLAGAPLENLGLVHLVERLALAIAEQKAANEAVIEADAAAEAAADRRPSGPTREAMLRRLGAIAAGEPLEAPDGSASSLTASWQAPAASPGEAVVPIRPAVPAHLQAATGAKVPAVTDEALHLALATFQRMTARG